MIERTVPIHENWVCFVGSGECLTPATHVIDNGAGEEAYICEKHYHEFNALERQIDKKLEEDPNFLHKFIQAIEAVE